MRSEGCITRDLRLEWGILLLRDISAYIKIKLKKIRTTTFRPFDGHFQDESKKISMFFTSQLENDRQTVEMSLSLF